MKTSIIYKCEHCGFVTEDNKQAMSHECLVAINPFVPIVDYEYKAGLKYPSEITVNMQDGAKAKYVFTSAVKLGKEKDLK